jgi:hypothetical protein
VARQIKGRILVTGTVRDEAEQKEGACVLRPNLQDIVAPRARRFDATLGEIESEAAHERPGLRRRVHPGSFNGGIPNRLHGPV